MDRRRGHRQGFTMVELLVVIAIIALLAAFLLPVIAAATASARRANCSNKQRQILLGVQMYLNNFDEYFPPAFLSQEPTSGADADYKSRFGYLGYWRFLVHEFCEAGFSAMLQVDKGETVTSKVARDKIFWTDPARGFTGDYFAPRVFNGQVDTDGTVKTDALAADVKWEGEIAKTQATQTYSASQLPILSEVDTGYKVADPPDWKGRSDTPPDNAHKALLKSGWTLTTLPGGAATDEILIGVGRATRDVGADTAADSSKLYDRFDFRHNGAINVLFLDNHVEQVSETNATRILAIREAWNSLTPPGTP